MPWCSNVSFYIRTGNCRYTMYQIAPVNHGKLFFLNSTSMSTFKSRRDVDSRKISRHRLRYASRYGDLNRNSVGFFNADDTTRKWLYWNFFDPATENICSVIPIFARHPSWMITMESRYVRVFHVADYVCTRSRARVHSKHGVTCVNYNDKCGLGREQRAK